jgi:adenine-specific DNA-methyltransferase
LNYIGSKRKLANSIKAKISQICPSGIFCDLFAGTGAVSEKFGEYNLIVNDWEDYSYAVNFQKFGHYVPENLSKKVTLLNSVESFEGFIAENYSPSDSSERMYYTYENACMIDAIRCEIEEISSCEEEKIYLTAILLYASDKVANTASVYGAYLKKFKNTALNPITLIEPPKFSHSGKIYCEDANTLDVSGNIVYLDPPYNTRHYGSNYHLLNTITNYNEFIPKGKTGLPEYKKSPYCSKVKIKKAMSTLLENLDFEHIFISYNDEGILLPEDFEDMCQKFKTYEKIILDESYQRFKADSSRKQKQLNTIEYLFYVSK